MEFRVHQPPPELAPYVHCYWTLKGESDGPQTIFPDGRSEIVIQRGDLFSSDGAVQPRAIFVGQMRGPVSIASTGKIDSIGIRFRPAGAHAFLRFSQSEIAGKILDLDDIDAKWAGDFSRSVERALFARLKTPPHGALDHAIRTIANARGAVSMDRVAESAEMTLRQLQRLFGERVGLDPKTFARIVRFQNVLSAAGDTWAGVAADAGYFDQAHLIRDFRQFTGETPAVWAERRVAFLQDSADERA